jgi:hypothetical protein
MESNALRVVAGAGGDYAAPAFIFVQRKNLVQCATLFERSGSLQVLELQEQWQSGQLRKVVRQVAWRAQNGIANSCAGCLDAG